MVQRAWLSHVRHLGSFLPPATPPSSGKTQNPSSLVSKVDLSGCNICAWACARMSSVRTVWRACWTTPASCFFFSHARTNTHRRAHGSSLIIKQPTHTVDWFGSQGDVAGELDLIEFLLQVSTDPIQYQHGFSGLQRHSRYTPLRKIRGLKDLWRLS